MVLTADCYVFALLQAGGANVNAAARYLDVCGQLLETVITKQPTAFAGLALECVTTSRGRMRPLAGDTGRDQAPDDVA